MSESHYKTDPERAAFDGITGIYVRAQDADGRWTAADIMCLDHESRKAFLRSRDTVEWAAGTAERVMDVLATICQQFNIQVSQMPEDE